MSTAEPATLRVVIASYLEPEHIARIRAVDVSRARAAPGAVAVYTADDLDVRPLRATSRMCSNSAIDST